MKIFVLSLMLGLSSVATAANLKVSDTTFVADDGINLRAKPDANGPKVATLKQFTKITILEIDPKKVKVRKWSGRWLKVKTETQEGYLLDTFLMDKFEKIEQVFTKDTFWEIGKMTFRLNARDTTDANAAQGNISLYNKEGEMITNGTGEGYVYCYYDAIYASGKTILLRCLRSGENPDHTNEGEKQGRFVHIEKIDKKTIKLVKFASEL